MNRYGMMSLALAGFIAISPILKAADVPDSEQVSQLLSDAKTDAFQLKEDASTMHLYSTRCPRCRGFRTLETQLLHGPYGRPDR